MISSSSYAAEMEVWNGETVLADPVPYASVSPDYGVGSSNIAIFGPVASKLPYGTNYVYWRNGQYEYCLAYSPDLEFDGSRFTSPEVTILTYTTSTGYNSQATFEVSQDTNFVLSPGSYLVWSDLGDYPTLYERGGEDYAKLACVILCSFALYYLWHHMWSDIRQRYI